MSNVADVYCAEARGNANRRESVRRKRSNLAVSLCILVDRTLGALRLLLSRSGCAVINPRSCHSASGVVDHPLVVRILKLRGVRRPLRVLLTFSFSFSCLSSCGVRPTVDLDLLVLSSSTETRRDSRGRRFDSSLIKADAYAHAYAHASLHYAHSEQQLSLNRHLEIAMGAVVQLLQLLYCRLFAL